jgi:hypothetical protein
MKKFIYKLFAIFLFITITTTNCVSDWTFLVYMESSDQMQYWALKNINDMMLAQPNKNVNVLVQLHLGQNIAWRYKVTPGNLKFEGCISIGSNVVDDVVNSMKWAVGLCSAKSYCLDLWDHGFGILDPAYVAGPNNTGFNWDVELDGVNCEDDVCTLRGLLFNDASKTYMNNTQMIEALNKIKSKVLHGKKINILGTDCCKMAMVEVGYQIRDYVSYLVGSQNCEIMDGWDYKELLNSFKKGNQTTFQTVKAIVSTYGAYCSKHAKQGLYTQSALNLSAIDKLIHNMNEIVVLCKKVFDVPVYVNKFRRLIKRARAASVKICDSPYYTCLSSFYSAFSKELKGSLAVFLPQEIVQDLQKYIERARDNIKDAVVANTTGRNMSDAKGISIYFPNYHIDSSYLDTAFAKETLWLDFLRLVINEE